MKNQYVENLRKLFDKEFTANKEQREKRENKLREQYAQQLKEAELKQCSMMYVINYSAGHVFPIGLS